MLIEEIRAALALPPAPLPRPEVVAQKYRSLPKEYRKAVNALHRAGGELPSSEFPAAPSLRAALQELGFAYVLSSPDRVVAPLETLFAVPLIEGNPETLVEALRGYSSQTLRRIAAAAGVEAAGVDDVALRARLHRAATSGRTLEGIDPMVLQSLRDLAGGIEPGGWTAREFCSAAGIEGPSWDGIIVDALPSGESELADLARRMVVIPVRDVGSGSRWFETVTVPLEMRRVIAARLGERPRRTCAEEMEAATFQPAAENDGARLAMFLPALERESVGLTQAGRPNLRDLRRLERRFGWAASEAGRVAALALVGDLAGMDPREDRLRPTARGWAFLAGTPAERFRVLADLARKIMRNSAVEAGGSAAKALEEALFSYLDPAGAVPGSKVCLHCAAARVTEAVRKNLKTPRVFGTELGAIVRAFVQGLGETAFHLGLAEAALQGKRVVYLRWRETGPAGGGAGGAVTVQPTGEVIVPPGAAPAEDLAALARVAEVRSVEPVLVFALGRAAVMEAARRGENLIRLRGILETRSGRPLPQAVAFLLEEIGSRVGEVRIVPCSAVVEVRDPSMLEGMNLVRLSDRFAAIPEGLDPEAFKRAFERKGYFARWESSASSPVLDEGEEEVEDGDEDPCHAWAAGLEGVRERVLHSSRFSEPLEVEMRGGRRHRLEGVSWDGGRIAGWDRETGRPVMLDAASVIRARSASF
jgi:hypothetical protein